MVHLLAVELVMDIAARMKQLRGEDIVLRLGFLKAEDVWLLLVQEAFYDMRAGADGIDVPGSDLELGHGEFCSALSRRVKEGLSMGVPRTLMERPLLRGLGARADQAFVTQGDRR